MERKTTKEELRKKIDKHTRDIELLGRSVAEKWFPIWKREKTDEGAANCPLCHEYKDCTNCPIQQDTGMVSCYDTPYEDEWIQVAGIGETADSLKKGVAVLQEITYLQNLAVKLSKQREGYLAVIKSLEEEEITKEKVLHPFLFHVTLNKMPSAKERINTLHALEEFLRDAEWDIQRVGYSFSGKLPKFYPRLGTWGMTEESIFAKE